MLSVVDVALPVYHYIEPKVHRRLVADSVHPILVKAVPLSLSTAYNASELTIPAQFAG